MADFFEDFGKKISDVAGELGKKTEDTIEVQKIKSQIRSLKRANERDIAAIGQMVYGKYQDGALEDTDYTELCEAVAGRETEIAGKEEEIRKIKEV